MYDEDTADVVNALQNSSTSVFSNDTISQILALAQKDNSTVRFDQVSPDTNGNVTVASGAEVVLIDSSNTFQTTIKPPANAPVVIFQGKGGVVATLNDGVTQPSGNQSQVDRVVVGSAGNDKIIVSDAKNTKIILGTGNSTVTTGSGVDTVEAGLGNSSIVGGSGDYSVVKLSGNATNYQVTAQNGHAVVTNTTTNKTTDITKIQYVQLDNGNALVFAKNSVEGQVATLYHTAFGRDADAGGLDFWFDAVKSGATMKQVAGAFANSAEFIIAHAGQDDTAFIQSLYQNTFNRAGEDAGVNFWLNALANGSSRADLMVNFASIAVQNIQGEAQNVETQVIGSVKIIQNII